MNFTTRKKTSTHTCGACFDQYYTTISKRDVAVAQRCKRCKILCEACNGDGVIFSSRPDGYQVVADCPRCTNLEMRMKRFNEARLPARYFDKDFGGFNIYSDEDLTREVGNLNEIRSLLHNYAMTFTLRDRGILLTGRVGTGKTHLMIAFVRYLTLEKGMQCRFIEFTHLLSELREAYETRQNAADILNNLSAVPILFIDELGKGRKSDWELGIIDELISKRYNACLPTFFTTNYPLNAPRRGTKGNVTDTEAPDYVPSMIGETLGARVGERIVSRIFEMCEVKTITDDVPDFRDRQRRRRQQEQEGAPRSSATHRSR